MYQDAHQTGVQSVDLAEAMKPTNLQREEDIEQAAAYVPSRLNTTTQKLRKPYIFLSYAHEDQAWVARVFRSLNVLIHSERITVWADRLIGTGAPWETTIFTEIEKSNTAILVLSPDFLASKFILSKELPAIFAEKERRDLSLIPILARPCAFELHEGLAKFQMFNDPENPLSSLTDWKVDSELARLTREIARMA